MQSIKKGGLAQLARAFAWHAKGHRFDSGNLHFRKVRFFAVLERPESIREGHPNINRYTYINTLAFFAGFHFMPFYVYILFSQDINQYYIGHSEDENDRLYRHNNSGSKSTKKTNDRRIVYTELFNSKPEAVKREMEIKKKKSRKYIEWLISSAS